MSVPHISMEKICFLLVNQVEGNSGGVKHSNFFLMLNCLTSILSSIISRAVNISIFIHIQNDDVHSLPGFFFLVRLSTLSPIANYEHNFKRRITLFTQCLVHLACHPIRLSITNFYRWICSHQVMPDNIWKRNLTSEDKLRLR